MRNNTTFMFFLYMDQLLHVKAHISSDYITDNLVSCLKHMTLKMEVLFT